MNDSIKWVAVGAAVYYFILSPLIMRQQPGRWQRDGRHNITSPPTYWRTQRLYARAGSSHVPGA